MSWRFGPFHFVYTSREQKIRDTIKHMVAKYGIVRARMMVNAEYQAAIDQLGGGSPQAIWWNDVRWNLKSLVHSLNYGSKIGL